VRKNIEKKQKPIITNLKIRKRGSSGSLRVIGSYEESKKPEMKEEASSPTKIPNSLNPSIFLSRISKPSSSSSSS